MTEGRSCAEQKEVTKGRSDEVAKDTLGRPVIPESVPWAYVRKAPPDAPPPATPSSGHSTPSLRHSVTPSLPSPVVKAWPPEPTVPPAASAEMERLRAAVHLLDEAWRHLNGAQGHAPSDRLSRAMNAVAELETDLATRILVLGRTVDAKGRGLSGDSPARASVFDAADVSGKIRPGEALRCGPLSIAIASRRSGYELIVELASRAKIEIGFDGGAVDFVAVTAGLDYPEIVELEEAPPADAGDLSGSPSLRPSVPPPLPLVSAGQGDSTVEIHEEDVR